MIAPIPSGTLGVLLKRLERIILSRRFQTYALKPLHRETLRADLVISILPH